MSFQVEGSWKHLTLCGHHAAELLRQFAQERPEHPALMEIYQKKLAKQEREAVARGERVKVSKAAQSRGFQI